MSSFNDYSVALRSRDVFIRLAEGVVNRLRPDPKIGEVYDFVFATATAYVVFPGESVPLKVAFSRGLTPTHKKMDLPDGSAQGDIVRVAGRLGNYYVVSILGSGDTNPVATILEYGGATAPEGYLLCQGSFVSKTTYAALFAKIGHAYNGGTDPGDGTFKLPDRRDKMAVGASGTRALGSTGGSETKAVPAHTHSTPNHTHTDNLAATTGTVDHSGGTVLQGTGSSLNRVGLLNGSNNGSHSHTVAITGGVTSSGGGTTGAASGSAFDVMNPYVASNFIIKY